MAHDVLRTARARSDANRILFFFVILRVLRGRLLLFYNTALMLQLLEPYKARPVRFLELWSHLGWRIKLYGIAYERRAPGANLISAAKRVAADRLPQPAGGQGRYGVGFVGVHEGRGANFVFVDWWADENELHHHVYISSSGDAEGLEHATPSGLMACVWDLRVIGFERDCWVDMILANPKGPDLEGYLARRLNEDV